MASDLAFFGPVGPPHHALLIAGADLPTPAYSALGHARPSACKALPKASPLRFREQVPTFERGAGILTGCPSLTPFGLGLGPPNPGTTSVAQETLGIRCPRFSLRFRYSCRQSLFRIVHQTSQSGFDLPRNAPLPRLVISSQLSAKNHKGYKLKTDY